MKLQHFFFGLFALILATAAFMVGHYRALYNQSMEDRRAGLAAPMIPGQQSPFSLPPALPQQAPQPLVPPAVAPVAAVPAAPAVAMVPAAPAGAAPDLVAAQVNQAAQQAADAAKAQAAELQRRLKALETENRLLTAGGASIGSSAPADAASELQTKVRNAPTIARVKEYHPNEALVVLDQGKNVNFSMGKVYSVRRSGALVAKKIIIGESVEDTESVAEVDTKSLLPGDELKPGDEVVLIDGI